jgi:hypothetical protein
VARKHLQVIFFFFSKKKKKSDFFLKSRYYISIYRLFWILIKLLHLTSNNDIHFLTEVTYKHELALLRFFRASHGLVTSIYIYIYIYINNKD